MSEPLSTYLFNPVTGLIIVIVLAIILFFVRLKEGFANKFFYQNPDDIRKNEYEQFQCKNKSCRSKYANTIGVNQRPSYKGFDNFYM